MSGRPILDDTDFNFTEIMKGRLENVSSLPTGLGTDEKGYSVYYNDKIWVWDGTNWNTWDNKSWTDESTNSLDPANPRDDDTVTSATSNFLHQSDSNINLSEGYNDNSSNTLGTLHFIGSSGTVTDWDDLKGRRFVYTAKDGSWFNIKDNSTQTIPANHKKIDTGTNTNIDKVTKAEFSYNNNIEKWVLISFERKEDDSYLTRNDLTQELKQIICCKNHLIYELISSSSGDKLMLGDVPKGLKITGDPCYYFKIKIEGEWGANPSDNDCNTDFTSQPIYCQYLTRSDESSAWTFIRSTEYVWSSGDTISFNEEFIFTSDEDIFIGCSLSDQPDDHGNPVIPIQNFELFHIKMTVIKCAKTSWFKRFDIPESSITPVTIITGNVPADDNEGLPFDGFYHFDMFLRVIEYDSDQVTNYRTENPQTLELDTPGDSWRLIDESGNFIPLPQQQLPEWYNNSLQGSVMMFVQLELCGQRDVKWKATLPNGSFRQILGGYLHARYLGGTEGIVCNEII